MGICLPKENTFDPIQPPIFAFEILVETRGRHLSCQSQHKRFYLFMIFASYRFAAYCKVKNGMCTEGEGRSVNDVRTCIVCCCNISAQSLLHTACFRIRSLTRCGKKHTPKTHLPLHHFFRPLAGRCPYVIPLILAKKPEENWISRPFFRLTKFQYGAPIYVSLSKVRVT